MTVMGGNPPATVTINEMTTVASVWTHAQFLDGTAIKGPCAQPAHRRRQRPELRRSSDGRLGEAIQDPLNSGQTPTMANFATLADVLSGCVTRVTPDACHKLFTATTPPKGDAPNDTLTAAQSIARYPWYQPERLFASARRILSGPARARTCARFRSCRISTSRRAPGCCRSNSTAAAIAPAARRCSTAKATSGSATILPLGGRGPGQLWQGNATKFAPNGKRFRPSLPALPAAGCRGAPSGGRRRQRQCLVRHLRRQVDRRVRQERQAADAARRHHLRRPARADAGHHRHAQRRRLGARDFKEPTRPLSQGRSRPRARIVCEGRRTRALQVVVGPFHLAIDQQDRIWVTNGFGPM